MTDHGHFHWNELMTRDPEAAMAFYGNIVGWTFSDMDMGEHGTYWICMDGDKACGGIYTMSGPQFEGVPEQWLGYLAVDDIDARLDKAKAAGATVLQPIIEIPGVGRFTTVKDPTGATLGWITPGDED